MYRRINGSDFCNKSTTLFTRDTNKDIEQSVCTCGANIACSRPRIGILNDTERTNKYIDALSKVSYVLHPSPFYICMQLFVIHLMFLYCNCFIDIFETFIQIISPEDICLSINDGALIALVAARLGAKHVYAIELERMCNMMLKKYVQENNLEDKVTVLDKKPDELSLVDIGGTQVCIEEQFTRYLILHECASVLSFKQIIINVSGEPTA